MVRALFPHAFRGRRLVNRDRFRAGGGQFERIGLLETRRRAARSALLPLPLSPSRARLREAWLRPSAPGRALDPLAEPGNDHRAAPQERPGQLTEGVPAILTILHRCYRFEQEHDDDKPGFGWGLLSR